MMKPRVIDIYSLNKVVSDSFQRAAEAGIWACIHKATEGNTFKDKGYKTRRKLATDAGMLWGAYHFNLGNDVKAQVDNFLSHAEPDENTLVCLDFEDYRKGNMTIQSAIAFMKEVEDRTGKLCAIYSGNRLKETIQTVGAEDVKYISERKLWICQYGPRLIMPKGIDKDAWFLWQYTGDGVGPKPHTVPGFEDGIDLSVYNGESKEEFATKWIS